MIWLVWSLIVLFLIILIVVTVKVTIKIEMLHDGDNDHYKIHIKTLYGLIRHTIDIPLIKVNKQKPEVVIKQKTKNSSTNNQKKKRKKITPKDVLNSLHNIQELTKHIVGLRTIVRKFLQRIHIQEFEWHTYLGIGDAAHTGILSGIAWSFKSFVLQLLSKNMKLMNPPQITITPDFNHLVSKTSLKCMIHFRLGYAILAGLRFVKYWIGGKPNLKGSIPSLMKNDNNDQSA